MSGSGKAPKNKAGCHRNFLPRLLDLQGAESGWSLNESPVAKWFNHVHVVKPPIPKGACGEFLSWWGHGGAGLPLFLPAPSSTGSPWAPVFQNTLETSKWDALLSSVSLSKQINGALRRRSWKPDLQPVGQKHRRWRRHAAGRWSCRWEAVFWDWVLLLRSEVTCT